MNPEHGSGANGVHIGGATAISNPVVAVNQQRRPDCWASNWDNNIQQTAMSREANTSGVGNNNLMCEYPTKATVQHKEVIVGLVHKIKQLTTGPIHPSEQAPQMYF